MYTSGSGIKYDKLKDIIQIIKNKLLDGSYLVIGCDSQKARRRKHTFVLAIALVDKGNGGIFFIKRWKENKKYSLAEKLYKEAALLISLTEKLKENKINTDNIELHLDLSKNGKSRKFINGVIGMCTGYGYTAKIKDDSWAANGLADRFSRK